MCGGGGGGDDRSPTNDEKVIARIAGETYHRNRQIYDGVESEFMDYSDSIGSDTQKRALTAMTMAGVTGAYDTNFSEIAKALTSGGVKAGDGAFMSALVANANGKMQAMSDNTNRSMQALDDQSLQAQTNVVALGNKKSGSAIQGLSDIASLSSQESRNSARQSAFDDQASEYMVGQVAGAGYSAYQNRTV